MKANEDSAKDRNLDPVLNQWVVEAPLPPRFQEQVWQRIARAEVKEEAPFAFWARVLRLVEANLPRPQFAYSYVVLLVLLGVISGAWAAQRESHRLNTDLGYRYVQSIDPYHKIAPRQ